MVQLEHPDSGHHPHISAPIFQPRSKRSNKVLNKISNPQRAKGPQGETTDHWILISAVLLKEIDGEECKIGVRARIVANIEVAHLLQNDVGSSGAHDHLAEGGGDIDADGHVGDHALEKITL